MPLRIRFHTEAKDQDEMGETRRPAQAAYEIRVEGELDEDWVDWFDGMAVVIEHTSDDVPATTLTGPVSDQPALRGMLSKLWDLNLTLISVHRIETGAEEENGND